MSTIPRALKECSRCHRCLSLESFSRDHTRPDGRYPRCKQCRAAIRQEKAAQRRPALRQARRERWERSFWDRIDRSGGPDACWPWRGGHVRDGYGTVRFERRTLRTHRVAWEMTYGSIPNDLSVLHNCPGGDNPACCNPAHLFLGTQAENIADMMAKGRSRAVHGNAHWTRAHPERVLHGEQTAAAKLTADQVREIRRRYAAGGVSQPQLAREYGVTHPLIGMIVRRRAWRHLDE